MKTFPGGMRNFRKLRGRFFVQPTETAFASGEVDENGLIPRNELIDLTDFTTPGQYQPATWEGCVVKISDKIAYLGRDIEDAINLGFLDETAENELVKMAKINDDNVLNTTVIMYNLIIDICKNSTPDKGICLSSRFLEQINRIKDFNYKHIYRHERLEPFKEYSELAPEKGRLLPAGEGDGRTF